MTTTTTTATHLLERRLGMSRVRRHCMLTLYECNNNERQRQRRRRRQNYYEPNSARATLTHLSGSPLPTPFRQSAPALIFPRIVAGGQTPNGVASVAPSNEGEVACAHLSLLPLPSRRSNLCAHGCVYVCKYTHVCV